MMNRDIRLVSGGIFLVLLLSRNLFAADRPLGTVFYSPAERTALVALRHGGSGEKGGAEGESADQGIGVEEIPRSRPYAVSGIVSRSSGRSVVWINGQPVAESMKDEGLPPLRLGRDHVDIDGKSVKVGEELDPATGQRISPLPAGAVKVTP